MTEAAQKRCSKCGQAKPAEDFYAAKGGLLGRRPDCKRCANVYHNCWARRRYVPKTGRRYVTRGDRARQARAAREGKRTAGRRATEEP